MTLPVVENRAARSSFEVTVGLINFINLFIYFTCWICQSQCHEEKILHDFSTKPSIVGELVNPHLVGGLEHLDYISIYWECHHPN